MSSSNRDTILQFTQLWKRNTGCRQLSLEGRWSTLRERRNRVPGVYFSGPGRRCHGGLHGSGRRRGAGPRDGAFAAYGPAHLAGHISLYAIAAPGPRRSAAVLEEKTSGSESGAGVRRGHAAGRIFRKQDGHQPVLKEFAGVVRAVS